MPDHTWKAGDLAWVARGPHGGVYLWRPVVVCGAVSPRGRVSVEERLAMGVSRGAVSPWMLRPRAEGEPPAPIIPTTTDELRALLGGGAGVPRARYDGEGGFSLN